MSWKIIRIQESPQWKDQAAQWFHQKWGIPALYLLTDHNSFYERYGWEFLCMVQGEGETEPSRMYRYSPSIK